MRAYADVIPPEDEIEEDEQGPGGFGSSLRRQGATHRPGLQDRRGGQRADLYLGGFDTHDNHDSDPRLAAGKPDLRPWTTCGNTPKRRAWRTAWWWSSAPDFGRTNLYNSQRGKDHWPIGSYIVMEKGQTWTNRVVGLTDELHFAYAIDPRSLRRNDRGWHHHLPQARPQGRKRGRYLNIEKLRRLPAVPVQQRRGRSRFFG